MSEEDKKNNNNMEKAIVTLEKRHFRKFSLVVYKTKNA